ncbi:MAG: hypothetical protein LBN32_00695 [Helicobacteraceae bacterium]|nr:hypothetical protein [Helicobacteraceae bacterium]
MSWRKSPLRSDKRLKLSIVVDRQKRRFIKALSTAQRPDRPVLLCLA